MFRFAALACAIAALAACAAQAPRMDEREVRSSAPLPSPQNAGADAAPKILGVHLSSLRVKPGDVWSGRITTTTNVASLEVRTPSFTFSAPRTTYGDFAFTVHALVVMPLYRRPYTVALIARNAAGVQDERDVTVDFR